MVGAVPGLGQRPALIRTKPEVHEGSCKNSQVLCEKRHALAVRVVASKNNSDSNNSTDKNIFIFTKHLLHGIFSILHVLTD